LLLILNKMTSNILIKTLPEENYNKVTKEGNIFLTRIGFYRETNNPIIGDDLEGTRGFRFEAKEKIKFSNSDFPILGNIKILDLMEYENYFEGVQKIMEKYMAS